MRRTKSLKFLSIFLLACQPALAFDGVLLPFDQLMSQLSQDLDSFFGDRKEEIKAVHDDLEATDIPTAIKLAKVYLSTLKAKPELVKTDDRAKYVNLAASWMQVARDSVKKSTLVNLRLAVGVAYAEFFLDEYRFLTRKEREKCVHQGFKWLSSVPKGIIDGIEAATWLGRMELFLGQKWLDAARADALNQLYYQSQAKLHFSKGLEHYSRTTKHSLAFGLVYRSNESEQNPITRQNLP